MDFFNAKSITFNLMIIQRIEWIQNILMEGEVNQWNIKSLWMKNLPQKI